MPVIRKSLALTLTVVLLVTFSVRAAGAPAPSRQEHVVAGSEMDATLSHAAAVEEQHRETIRRVLHHPRVEQVAKALGLDVARADAAVSTLEGAALAQVASQATNVDRSLAGGQSLTITYTTLIIILLVVIILILVA